MSTKEKKIFDAARELTGGGPPAGGSARAQVDGARAKTQRLLASAGEKVDGVVSGNPEKTLQVLRQGTGE